MNNAIKKKVNMIQDHQKIKPNPCKEWQKRKTLSQLNKTKNRKLEPIVKNIHKKCRRKNRISLKIKLIFSSQISKLFSIVIPKLAPEGKEVWTVLEEFDLKTYFQSGDKVMGSFSTNGVYVIFKISRKIKTRDRKGKEKMKEGM